MKRVLVAASMLVIITSILQGTSTACPSCYGDPGSAEVQGMQWAILSLLGVTGSVLVGVSAFFLYLRKRAHELNRLFSDRLN